MTQSSELGGGEGFTFEGDAAGFYLAALLAEAYAPGVDDRIVVRVSVQQRAFGEKLDDLIVDFEDVDKHIARLSLQVKRSLTISKAKTNEAFREVIHHCWATLKKPDFRIDVDRYGAAVGTVAPAKERALKTLCDWARESLTADHFGARFAEAGNASKQHKRIKDDCVALLREAKGAPPTLEEVHEFLAHFVLIQFDFLREGATDPPDAIDRIRDCLAPSDATKAPAVWAKVVQLARVSAGKSGQFDRARHVRAISPVGRLRGATSLRRDLDKLTELAKSYVKLIPDDVGGTRLERARTLEELDAKLASGQIIQIRGLPGTGKSVVVRRAVERALDDGSVLFLKAEQLEGTSWISYATSQGLSDAPLERLLVEIAATGTPIFFVDAIDRIATAEQPVIVDVIRTISESPLLDTWRVIVSLRDTGIEVLRNWLGEFLDARKVETLAVSQLSDEEADALAEAKPHLRPLLFGSAQVQEIVRRPFFAKVLNQSYVADSRAPTFAPQSEVDLIENWWRRGGYNETGQGATERQRSLLDLARVRARQLSQPIGLGQLKSVAHIDGLRSDGIIQDAREGISVRFAHDIFFEWAFFHVLADSGPQWMEAIRACGEPPSLARVVELASQWEYSQGRSWSTYLVQAEAPNLRSQWLRAWLLGPLGSVGFETDDGQFVTAAFADDFRLLRKALVWLQAEKTTPNAGILSGELPQEQRQRYADLLGWPSDFSAWRRFIEFILRRISDIPQRLYPEIVAIFEVWQNALSSHRNPTSVSLLQECAKWLAAIDKIDTSGSLTENSTYWKKVPNLDTFQTSVAHLLLKSSIAEPTFAEEYLQRVAGSERIGDDQFSEIIIWSPILAQSLPSSLVQLSLSFLRKLLPDEQVAREEQRLREAADWRQAILAKPKAERSRQELMALSSGPPPNFRHFGYHDWETLSIHDDHRSFGPPSPLREPFHSLFQSSPDEALRLLHELCNHAVASWRQLHRYSHDRQGTPVPLELRFPWGTQSFWGTEREYLWTGSTRAPKAVGCGFMALEEWCFGELERGQSVDKLLKRILEGNECIAILSIAGMLALHTETVSETTLPLFTSQRLLAADHNRWLHNLTPGASLTGFSDGNGKRHSDAIQVANARPVRKLQLRMMVPRFVFAEGPIRGRAREAIRDFKNCLPFLYEEHRAIPEVRASLTAQALEYGELAESEHYQMVRTEENSDDIAIVHVSPTAAEPENVARAAEATKRIIQANLWTWASRSFDERTLSDTYTVEEAIALGREAYAGDLFENASYEDDEGLLGIRRGAVAATAAIALSFREGVRQEDLEWSRSVLRRAIRLREDVEDSWPPGSVIPWHPAIFVARGIGADLCEGTEPPGAALDLLGLIAHPLEVVSLAALEEAFRIWSKDYKLTWAALILALSLCQIPRRPRDQDFQHGDPRHSSGERQAEVDRALTFYENGSGWSRLPLPPPAWVEVDPREGQHRRRGYAEGEPPYEPESAEAWREPDVLWHSEQAAKILERIPFEEILGSSANSMLLDFLAGVLDWTNQKNAPPWVKPGRRDRSPSKIYVWTRTLGSTLGQVAGLLPLSDFRARFLDPVLRLESADCWALLAPFTNTYICVYVYDAPVVPADAIATLELCLDRLLQDAAFKREVNRSGSFSGFDLPKLVHALMFVSVEHADLAARYVNGDWSEIGRILPLVDRFVRAGGRASAVMNPFLTLCERAKDNYPADAFADQVLEVIGEGPHSLKGWHGTSIPARVAELVQHFAHSCTPMKPTLAQDFLRILDMLVDMGDRRSAALQLSETFREIRLSS